MDAHRNARQTQHRRMLIIERAAAGWTTAAVAAGLGTTPRTVRTCLARSSRPHRSPAQLPAAAESRIGALCRQRLSGPAIARPLGRPGSTVGHPLRRLGLGRLAALRGKPPISRINRDDLLGNDS